MERPLEFTRIEATYKPEDGTLAGPYAISFDARCVFTQPCTDASYECDCKVTIQQGPGRVIAIEAARPAYWGNLLLPLSQVERLLMVFYGSFVPLENIQFSGPEGPGAPKAEDCKCACTHAMKRRLSYFCSADYMRCKSKLVGFQDVLTSELFSRWQKLLDDLDVVNQVYLYAVSDNGMPRDVSLAFVVEMAESLVELLKAERGLFPNLSPGNRGTTLRSCLDALIQRYGRAIFKAEFNGDYEGLLDRLKGTRVQIMHIKRNWSEDKMLDGEHCVLYIRKLSLLCRVILLDLLGFEAGAYSANLQSITQCIDEWASQFQVLREKVTVEG